MSAGRLYDKFGKKAKGKIVVVIPGGAICKVTDIGLDAVEKQETDVSGKCEE